MIYVQPPKGYKYAPMRLTQLKDLKELKSEIETAFGLDDLFMKSRKRELVMVRQIYTYIAFKKIKYPCTMVCREMDQNHSTVIKNCRTVEDLLYSKDPQFLQYWNHLKQSAPLWLKQKLEN